LRHTRRCATRGATHATVVAGRRRTGRARDTNNSRANFVPAVSRRDPTHRARAHGTAVHVAWCLRRAHDPRALAHTTVRDTRCDPRGSWRSALAHDAHARGNNSQVDCDPALRGAAQRTALRRTTRPYTRHSARHVHTVRALVAHTMVRDTPCDPCDSGAGRWRAGARAGRNNSPANIYPAVRGATRRTARRRTARPHARHSARHVRTVRALVAHTMVRDTPCDPCDSGRRALGAGRARAWKYSAGGSPTPRFRDATRRTARRRAARPHARHSACHVHTVHALTAHPTACDTGHGTPHCGRRRCGRGTVGVPRGRCHTVSIIWNYIY
jgi:hypothetical protein